MERAAHHDEMNFADIRAKIIGGAVAKAEGDAGFPSASSCSRKHFGLGIHGGHLGAKLCKGDAELARSAAEVEDVVARPHAGTFRHPD
jgi:hypothetical protein